LPKSIAGHTKRPRGPHAACGTRIIDPCLAQSASGLDIHNSRVILRTLKMQVG